MKHDDPKKCECWTWAGIWTPEQVRNRDQMHHPACARGFPPTLKEEEDRRVAEQAVVKENGVREL